MKNQFSCIEPLEDRIAPAFAAVFELSSLDGLNGFKLSGVAANDYSGRSVSDAGDVNGDGFDDLIIGAVFADPNGSASGASYVVFGRASGFSANLNLENLNGSNGFKISGVDANDLSGISVSAAGDVNGDGFDDLIIGAPLASPNGNYSGASYVVFGKAGGFAANLNLSTLDGSNGFKLSGVADDDRFGGSVSGAGDVNGDGFDDVIIGAIFADPNGADSGASYVVFGKAVGFSANVNLSTLDGSNGFKLSGVAEGDRAGSSVSAGDVNGDGFGDLIIGAPHADPNGNDSGASYVVFGKASGFAANLNLSTLDGSNGFKLSGGAAYGESGGTLSGAGDVNGDGFGDLIISSGLGACVVFGKASGFPADLNLSTVNGGNGFEITGDFAGVAVSGAGDVNGDGFDDLLIGAPFADPHGPASGASYVVFGKGSGFPASLNLSTLDGSNGFTLSGVAPYDYSGNFLSGAGDVNGDGFDDLIISAWRADPNGNFSGASYVVFGRGVEVSVSDATVTEGDGGTAALQFTVSLSEAGAVPVTVKVATADGSALATSDYAPLDATTALTFAPGETSKTITVNVLDDTLFENDETFSVVLSDITGGVIRDGTGVGTIRNDDAPPVVSIANASAVEGDAGSSSITFAVSLSTASGLPASVEFASADGTALVGSDYTALAPGTLNFAPGETNKTITVDVLGDTSIEDHEHFSVILFGANGATLGNRTAVGTILNDDTALRISEPTSAFEGDSGATTLVFTVGLEKPSALPVTVNYASADGTASAGSDYTALTGTLTFTPGETSQNITIDVHGDTTHEADETFSVGLSGATNAPITDGTATGTIHNDDAAPVITISDGSVVEGDSGTSSLVFTASLSAPSGLPATVRYTTADGTAVAGSDFTAPASGSQIIFAPGETSKTIMIAVNGDATIEAHEAFSLLLSDATNAMIASGAATGTILNDDTSLRIDDATLLEGHAGTRPVTFTVSLTAASALPVTVDFMSADGTATSGTDYTALPPRTLTFTPGETSHTITIEVVGDTMVEPSETFSVLLSDATHAEIEDGSGLATILDDDVTIVGKRKATFTDVDGDVATIKVSKGTLKAEQFTLFPSGLGSQLALVDFSGETRFTGANLSISAKRPAGTTGGAGLVHVGAINAAGIDLGKVVVQGDLGQIDAGDDLTPERGLLRLSAHSLGHFGLATQLPGGSMQSDITGALKTLKLADGMHDAALIASGDIGAVKVKGDVLGSAIRSEGNIGTLKISGDLAASATNIAIITARGTLAPASLTKALAIGSVSIGGSVEHAQILTGYDRAGAAVNGAAGIDKVVVGRNWIASDLVAGATAGADGLFGTDDDTPISGDTPIIAKIASIVIKGAATGTDGETDHFGFVAGEIGSFKSGGTGLTFMSGPGNDLAGQPVGLTGNLQVREVA